MTLDELNLHFDAVEQLNSARDRLQSMSSFLKAQSLDGMPQGAGEHRKVEQLSILIEQQEEEFEPKLKYLSRGIFRTAAQIFEGVFAMQGKDFDLADCKEAQKILALDKIFEAATGESALELAGIRVKCNYQDWYDKKRQGWHYLRKFRWVYKDIPMFREHDFVPDDDSEFNALMQERLSEVY